MQLQNASETTDYRAVLERGDILFFPSGGFEIPAEVRTALMGATQDARSFHKNIAYKPNLDQVSGLVDRSETETVRPAMREYSRCALEFLRRILPEYARAWKVDYASFRSIEERTSLIAHLASQTIFAVFHYLPLNTSEMGMRYGGREGQCPVAESVSDRLLRLPFYNNLTEEDQNRVIGAIRSWRVGASA